MEATATINRLEACDLFWREHPNFVYGHAHAVIEDGNIEDERIYLAISNIASVLAEEHVDYNLYDGMGTPKEQAVIILKFLADLLDLPEGTP